MVKFDEEKQNQRLAFIRKNEQEDLAQLLAARYGLTYLDLSRVPINIDALHVIKADLAKTANLAAFNAIGKRLQIAVLSPKTPEVENVIQGLSQRGYLPELFVVSKSSLERAWVRYGETSAVEKTEEGVFEISYERITKLLHDITTIADVAAHAKEMFSENKSQRTTHIFELILAGALAVEASDIHLEPEEEYVRLRYRLDGILTDVTRIDTNTYFLLLQRVKLLSGLKLSLKAEAQDGRFTVRIDTDDIEIRTSIIPDKKSESIVMRILNPNTIALSMEQLGIEPRLFEVIEREIRRPNGMIFTTGPTGSGKTTSLYAFLKKVHKPDIKILTIEDPIEYVLPGIVQTQAKKGYSFAQGLRAALRQDPDIIMVGEVRDQETAQIAINSALTGHLVFSTLHTNNAAGTFPRLIDLGVNPKVIGSAVNLTLAQRLVRRLCQECKKQAPLQGKEKASMDALLASITRTDIEIPPTDFHYVPGGCTVCNSIGYKGRVGLYEGILMDAQVDEAIRSQPSEADIRRAANGQNLLTMAQDGVLKILRGITTISELQRIVDIEV